MSLLLYFTSQSQTKYYSRIISSIVSKWLYSYVIHTLSEQLHYCNNCIRNTNRPLCIVYNTPDPMVKSGHNCWPEDWDSWPPDVVFRKLDYHIGSFRSIFINGSTKMRITSWSFIVCHINQKMYNIPCKKPIWRCICIFNVTKNCFFSETKALVLGTFKKKRFFILIQTLFRLKGFRMEKTHYLKNNFVNVNEFYLTPHPKCTLHC